MTDSKSGKLVRMKPRTIVGKRPAAEIRRAQYQTAAFVYDLASHAGEDAERAMKEALEMLGICACVDGECCP